MKLSKFVKRAKSESYCMVIHADDSGIWLGTRSALYNATELPEMEGKEQVGAVLDIDSKAWEKMFFDEKYAETGGAAFGMNLTDADPLEQEARRVPLEMFYKGMGLVGLSLNVYYELIGAGRVPGVPTAETYDRLDGGTWEVKTAYSPDIAEEKYQAHLRGKGAGLENRQ